jgi:hypothetical protein
MKSGFSKTPSIEYVAFDRFTGRILHTHSRFSVEHNDYVEIPADELKQVCSLDPAVLENLTDRDAGNLEFMKIGPQEFRVPGGPLMVDVSRGILVAQPKLSLTTDKREIQGDGKDNVKIGLEILSANGEPIHQFKCQIKVTTTRGKLSVRGGVVDLADGAAAITLTSVPETVSNVRVEATVLNALCAGGRVDLEFV